MGLFEETHAKLADRDRAFYDSVQAARDTIKNEILERHAAVFSEQTYEGNVEIALLHNMGIAAFESPEITNKYTRLVERIQDQPDEVVPILFVDPMKRKTTFVKVPREGMTFRSSKVYNPDEGETLGGRMMTSDDGEGVWVPNTVGITHKHIALDALVHTTKGNFLDPDDSLGLGTKMGRSTQFTLYASRVADGGFHYASENFKKDAFEANVHIIVGWEAIETALLATLVTDGANAYQAIKIKNFFTETMDLDTTQERTPRLNTVIQAAAQLQTALGNVATRK